VVTDNGFDLPLDPSKAQDSRRYRPYEKPSLSPYQRSEMPPKVPSRQCKGQDDPKEAATSSFKKYTHRKDGLFLSIVSLLFESTPCHRHTSVSELLGSQLKIDEVLYVRHRAEVASQGVEPLWREFSHHSSQKCLISFRRIWCGPQARFLILHKCVEDEVSVPVKMNVQTTKVRVENNT
jgi:hypothetical protein